MSYIGNTPFTAAFLTDTFSGNGSTVAFTMSVAPANTSSILVAVTGVVQDPSTYSVSGTTLTFSAAPPSGTSNISVRYLGIPASGVTTTAYRTVTDSTATAGQTTFTIPSYTVGYVDVYRNGVRLAAADYTATTGTTVVLASAASAGDFIETVSFYVSSVLNAIQQYNGLSVNQVLTSPTANTLTSASGSNLQLQTNGGTTALTLDTSGNAGLGVTPSAWGSGRGVLQLKNNTSLTDSSGAGIWGYNWYNDGASNKYITSDYASRLIQSGGGFQWAIAPSGTAGNAITFTQAMTLNASSNLQLGTTTVSAARLNVFSSDVNKQIVFSNNETYYGSVAHNAGTGMNEYRTEATGGHAFFKGTESTAGMTFDSSGNLLVGTTTATGGGVLTNCPSGWGIARYLTDQGGRRNWSISTETLNAGDICLVASTTNNGSPSTAKFQVRSDGSTYNGTGTYGTISDIKIKENVVDATPKLNNLMQVRVVNYNRIGEERKELGVIAQELEQIFPNMIDEAEDLVDGQPTGTTTKAVKYSVFVPMLIKAIQEQQAIITQLQADVAALKGQA